MLMQKAALTVLGAAFAIALASAPAVAAPVVLNPNFTINDAAENTEFNNGNLFFIQDWNPVGYASNSGTDPGQYNNGSAGGQTVVGFLSGANASLSQVVNGFVTGLTYRVSVGINARAGQPTPTFRILAGGNKVYGPPSLTAIQAEPNKTLLFPTVQSNEFVAGSESIEIMFANSSVSLADGTSLLTDVSISAVPEPLSLALLGVGLAGIGWARRR